MEDDTIAAIATAPGAAGIAVVRVSGPAAFAVARTVANFPPPATPPAQTRPVGAVLQTALPSPAFPAARFARFRDPATGATVDDGMLLLFQAPASYTGEDVAEFQCHGGRIAPALVLAAAIRAGARQAAPGEFTRRAFLNGKLDLARAEAVMDFIGAASERAAASAREQLAGTLSAKVNAIYDAVVATEADAEHLLDFEEGEIPGDFAAGAARRCQDSLSAIDALLATWRTGRLLREGALVVLCGRPNAGKSSLLNALLGRNRAIVSPVAGTTRDSIEEPFAAEGIPVRLVDTAGLRDASGAIEAEGVARAQALVADAALAIEVIDASSPDWRQAALAASAAGRLPVLNKTDLEPAAAAEADALGAIALSARTGAGVEALPRAIAARLDALPFGEGEVAVSERHSRLLETARASLAGAIQALADGGDGIVLAASALAASAQALGEITGRAWSGDLLDAIFGKFCVGK